MFGLRESRREERGRRERLNNILLFIVWFAIKRRKESILMGPTRIVMVEMTYMSQNYIF
jgi:hypothetical protein